MSTCICDFGDLCGGSGSLKCRGCGGDQCVCAACGGAGEAEGATLLGNLAAAVTKLSDAKLIAEALGRNGVQAYEIDAKLEKKKPKAGAAIAHKAASWDPTDG